MDEGRHGLILASIVAIVGIVAIAMIVEAKNDKVEICHKVPKDNPQTISVSVNALQAHLMHGDGVGACSDGEICVNDGTCGTTLCRLGFTQCIAGEIVCLTDGQCDGSGGTCTDDGSCDERILCHEGYTPTCSKGIQECVSDDQCGGNGEPTACGDGLCEEQEIGSCDQDCGISTKPCSDISNSLECAETSGCIYCMDTNNCQSADRTCAVEDIICGDGVCDPAESDSTSKSYCSLDCKDSVIFK